ncbi:hypothetical protein ACHWQZ_G010060 [Mnemiopsis leidyi]
MLPGWIYIGVAIHVLIAIVFISSLLYYHNKANTLAVKVATKVDKYLKEFGYDAAPFLPKWYNDLSTIVKLDYAPNTVCVVVLSNADMFDKTLPRYISEHDPELKQGGDCVDLCTRHYMNKAVTELFPDEDIEIMYDWELQTNSRLPKVNMSTAGHAAGLAFYNRPEEVESPSWESKRKMFGCSISPKYSGWFGYRAVLIFKNLKDDDIQYLPPHDAVGTQELKTKLIECFNGDWKDPAWRDIIFTDKRYSDEQLEYFNTLPADRLPRIQALMERFKDEEVKKDL